jgi:hypothetical protein
VLLSKRRSQLKQAVQVMVRQCMGYIAEAPDKVGAALRSGAGDVGARGWYSRWPAGRCMQNGCCVPRQHTAVCIGRRMCNMCRHLHMFKVLACPTGDQGRVDQDAAGADRGQGGCSPARLLCICLFVW